MIRVLILMTTKEIQSQSSTPKREKLALTTSDETMHEMVETEIDEIEMEAEMETDHEREMVAERDEERAVEVEDDEQALVDDRERDESRDDEMREREHEREYEHDLVKTSENNLTRQGEMIEPVNKDS